MLLQDHRCYFRNIILIAVFTAGQVSPTQYTIMWLTAHKNGKKLNSKKKFIARLTGLMRAACFSLISDDFCFSFNVLLLWTLWISACNWCIRLKLLLKKYTAFHMKKAMFQTEKLTKFSVVIYNVTTHHFACGSVKSFHYMSIIIFFICLLLTKSLRIFLIWMENVWALKTFVEV